MLELKVVARSDMHITTQVSCEQLFANTHVSDRPRHAVQHPDRSVDVCMRNPAPYGEEISSMAATPDPLPMEQDGQEEPSPAPPAQDLLSIDDAAAQARWEQLGEEELQREIARYRTSLQSLAKDLASVTVAANTRHGGGATFDVHSESMPALASMTAFTQPRMSDALLSMCL